MKVLGILQNQWFREPDRIRAMIERSPQNRRRILTMTLFMGGKTGRILQQVFGDAWCERIAWDEASPLIGGHAASSFPADPEHLRRVIAETEPEVIVTFGAIARAGINQVWHGTAIHAPHPCARHATALDELRMARMALDLLKGMQPEPPVAQPRSERATTKL